MLAHFMGASSSLYDTPQLVPCLLPSHTLVADGKARLLQAHTQHGQGSDDLSLRRFILQGLLSVLRGHAAGGCLFSSLASPSASKDLW